MTKTHHFLNLMTRLDPVQKGNATTLGAHGGHLSISFGHVTTLEVFAYQMKSINVCRPPQPHGRLTLLTYFHVF